MYLGKLGRRIQKWRNPFLYKPRVCIIGHGYWGEKLVTKFDELLSPENVDIADLRESRLPSRPNTHTDFHRFLGNVDACAIATPINTHYDLALECLRAGKHVLVEKPMAKVIYQARGLVIEAQRRRLVFRTDQTFLKAEGIVDIGKTATSYRWTGPASKTSDEKIFWTWAPHPVSIMLAGRGKPQAVEGEIRASEITLWYKYPENVVVYILMAWGGEQKRRQALNGELQRWDLEGLKTPSGRDSLFNVCSDFIGDIRSDNYLPDKIGLLTAEVMAWTEAELAGSRLSIYGPNISP